ncbi:thioredoxin family protein [Winogradskyella helgolandensis]|uniref:thioredoxin family protein n=1 Tax=Winogradskyella helgolandensis TaxID=2697010 RepID=UPI0015BBE9E0|nr:thioredoxin family protein [Winogradskyella helgolandensis]
MKKILVLLLLFNFLPGVTQPKANCEDILKMELNLDPSSDNLIKLFESFSLFKNCGFDDTDVEFLSNSPIIGTLIVQLASEKKKDSILTYQTLYDKLILIKDSEDYKNNKPFITTSLTLEKRPADISNWEDDKLLLQKLQVSEDFINAFYKYLKEHSNPNKTYKDVFTTFRDKEIPNKNIPKTELKSLFKNAGNVNYEEILKESIKLQKPLLLYFTGYACVNCRKMEQNTFLDVSIQERLKNDFHFVNLYVDDQSILPEDEWTLLDHNGKTIKSIGQKHSNLQRTKFSSNSQPYFVLIDEHGIILAKMGYTNDKEIFKNFLNSAN